MPTIRQIEDICNVARLVAGKMDAGCTQKRQDHLKSELMKLLEDTTNPEALDLESSKKKLMDEAKSIFPPNRVSEKIVDLAEKLDRARAKLAKYHSSFNIPALGPDTPIEDLNKAAKVHAILNAASTGTLTHICPTIRRR